MWRKKWWRFVHRVVFPLVNFSLPTNCWIDIFLRVQLSQLILEVSKLESILICTGYQWQLRPGREIRCKTWSRAFTNFLYVNIYVWSVEITRARLEMRNLSECKIKRTCTCCAWTCTNINYVESSSNFSDVVCQSCIYVLYKYTFIYIYICICVYIFMYLYGMGRQ